MPCILVLTQACYKTLQGLEIFVAQHLIFPCEPLDFAKLGFCNA